jgi:hypothetical protein
MIPNYQYDCKSESVPTCQTNKGLNMFNKYCLGEDSQERPNALSFRMLTDVIKSHKLVGRPISLKMDIEGS